MYDAKLSSRSVIHDSAGSAGRTMAEDLENPEDKVRDNTISVRRSKQFMRTVTAPARSPRRDHMDHYHHSCSEDLRMKGKKMMRAAPRAEATRAREDIRRSLFRKDFLPQGGVRRRPKKVPLSFSALARGALQAPGCAEDRHSPPAGLPEGRRRQWCARRNDANKFLLFDAGFWGLFVFVWRVGT